jgi:hypothetical protein
MASGGFQPDPGCAHYANASAFNVSMYNNSNASAGPAAVCEGAPTLVPGEFPARSPFRLGGSFYHAFFVAPVAASYTFKARFNDAGQVWLSPDALPQNKELVIDAARLGLGRIVALYHRSSTSHQIL